MIRRSFSTTLKMTFKDYPKPSNHVSASAKDVWSLVNEAANATEAEGTKVVNLGQGFFSYAPPKFAIKAAQNALEVAKLNQYAHTKGHPPLLKAIADAYSPYFGRKLDPATEIVVTAGANEGMYAAFTAYLNEGDEVIVFEPFFDQYISNIKLPGGKVVYVPLTAPEDDATRNVSSAEWTFDPEELKAKVTSRTKMIVINTPHNPIGKVFSRKELEIIGKIAVENNIIIVSDEVYDRLYYTDDFVRIATLSPELARLTLTVGSAGKTFAATGWRVGWVIGDPELIKYVTAAHTRIVFTVNTPLQAATTQAFIDAGTNSYYEDTRNAFKRKYEILNKVWEELGLPYTIPQGGYFVLVNFSKVKIPEDYVFPSHVTEGRAKDFRTTWWLIKEIGVVAIPPSEFYEKSHQHMAEEYLRFAVCKDDEMLEEAVVKLRGLKKYIES